MNTYTYMYICEVSHGNLDTHIYVCVYVYFPGPSRGVTGTYRFMCSTHREANDGQNFGVWSREKRPAAGPCKETQGQCAKNQILQNISAKHF